MRPWFLSFSPPSSSLSTTLERLLFLFLAFGIPSAVSAEAGLPQVRVLYISSFASDSSDTLTVVESLKRDLTAQGVRPEIYVESLDTYRLRQGEDTRKLFDEILDKRYSSIRFSIILAQASDAVRAAARYRQRLSYRPPVYCFDWIDTTISEQFSTAEGFFGRTLAMSFPATLDLAVTLFPQAKRVYLLVSPIGQEQIPMFRRDFADAQAAHPQVELVPLVNTEFDEVERTLATAGTDALAILLPGEWLLGTGEFLGGKAAPDRLAGVAAMPYFAITTSSLGSGLVGGAFANREQMGTEAAEMVRAILDRDPSLVAWKTSNALVPTVDDRALGRFDVPHSLVPTGAKVLFAPPSFWNRYELQLKVVGVLLGVLVIALMAVVFVRWRERRVLVRLNESLELTVSHRTKELSQANEELRDANEHLHRAMEDLRAAEDRMVVSEKLAALGRLTANISHELNSPLAAISSASGSITEYLGRGLGDVFAGPLSLDAETCKFLRDVLALSPRSGSTLEWTNPRAERKARDQVEAILTAAGVNDSYPLAEELVDLGIAGFADRAVPLLIGQRPDVFMSILRATLGALRAAVIVEDSVAKASRVVASLGTYARSTEDASQGPYQVLGIVNEVLGFFNFRSIRNVEVRSEVSEGLVVTVRRDDLVGILFHLTKNALQATQGSGVITLSAEAVGPVVRISVADTGPGVPDEIQGRIFEPFFSTRPIGEGAGVGLDVSRRLARKNGGDIVFRSVPGETLFIVELPNAGIIATEATLGH